MKALILRGAGQVELGERPDPVCGPFEAIVKVKAVSACNTDLQIIDNLIFPPAVGRAVGHEGVGEIVEIGSEVKHFKVGDRIVMPSLCPEFRSMEAQQGWAAFSNGGMCFDWCLERDGVAAEYARVRDVDMVCGKIPDGMDYATAVMMCDVVATAFNGVEHARIPLGGTAVVFGIGPIGVSCVAAAKARGAGKIYAIGTNAYGRDLALKFGADEVISYKDGDVVTQILEKEGGRRVAECIIAGGKGATVSQAYRLCQPGIGEITSVNAFYDDIVISPSDWNSGMETIRFTGYQATGGREMLERYMAFIEHSPSYDPSLIPSHINHGFEELEKTFRQKADSNVYKPVCLLD